MDIVGPLVRSSRGHQYILVVCDYATRFFQSFPLVHCHCALLSRSTVLKMLQKFVADTGWDWDQWLPFLLFAYREVPQTSTGFSPFELLYNWDVQGPLDLLLKTREAQATDIGPLFTLLVLFLSCLSFSLYAFWIHCKSLGDLVHSILALISFHFSIFFHVSGVRLSLFSLLL